MSDRLHKDLRSAMRQTLLTVLKAATGSLSISATKLSAMEIQFSRLSGSFVNDGFSAGDEIVATGYAAGGNNGRWLVTKLDDLNVTARLPASSIPRVLATETATVALTVGFPYGQKDENVKWQPQIGEPWFRESYKAGPELRRSIGPQAQVRLDWLYMMNVFYPSGVGADGVDGMVDAIRAVLYPGRIISYNSRPYTILASSRQGSLEEKDWINVPVSIRGFAYTITP